MAPSQASQALAKRTSDSALMPPPPPPKRVKRPPKVLDEDTYTDALSHIIARDYFPGLLETQTQQEYLDALESKDKEWIVEAGKRLTQVMTPQPRGRRGVSMTPMVGRNSSSETPRMWGGDTPISVAGETKKENKPEVDLNMSLSGFQAKYTSEDNESFNALLDRQNAKRAEKNAWMWSGNKLPSAQQIAQKAREARLLESGKAPDEEENAKALILNVSKADNRKAMPDHKPSAPWNSLMFAPDSIEDTHETVAQAAEAASRAGPKAVLYHNTRLQPASPSPDAIPPSPSLSAIQDALAGRPRPTESEPGYSGSETPRVNGYAFVDAEPAPGEGIYRNSTATPSEAQIADLSALLPSSSDTPNPFKISEASRREELHHRMVEKVARAKRSASGDRLGALRGSEAGSDKTLTPKFASSPVVKGNLTPAAQRLFERVGTPRRDGLGGAFGAVKKTMEGTKGRIWTPTPRVKRVG